MKKLQLILLVLCAGTMGFAQTTTDSLGENLTFNRRVFLENNQPVSNQSQFKVSSTLNMRELYRTKWSDSQFQTPTINLPAFSFKYIPPINLTDNLYNQYPINDWSWINTSHIMNNYYGLGGMNSVGANYNIKLGNFSVITAGVSASKYNIYNNFGNSSGLNGNIKFILSDRISINTFGQYSNNGSKNGIPPYLSTLYPNSFYGGSFEFKVTSKWGIITGAEQEFDVFSRKWVTRPFVMPVFYGH